MPMRNSHGKALQENSLASLGHTRMAEYLPSPHGVSAQQAQQAQRCCTHRSRPPRNMSWQNRWLLAFTIFDCRFA